MASLRIVFGALATSVRYPRVWLSVWAVVTVVALFAVRPWLSATTPVIVRHPGASYLTDPALDADLARVHADAAIDVLPGFVLLLLFGAFLAGGLLARVGLRGARFRFSAFLADCGRLFVRNLRVLLLGAVVALLLGWGVTVLDRWLREDLLFDVDPGAAAIPLYFFDIRWAHLLEALDYVWGVVFLLLVFASKVAMAHLAVGDRRSALMAWFVAAGKLLRHPLRSTVCVVLFALAWIGGATLLAWPTARLLEVEQAPWLGLAVGQLGILLGVWVMIAMPLAARRFHGEDAVSVAAEGTA